MSLTNCEDILKELINFMTSDNSLLYLSLGFNKLNTDFERVAKCYCLLQKYNLLQNFNCKSNKIKSPSVSVKYRNDGNRSFVQKDDMLAMYHYTRAVGYAPPRSQEISLAFANRSAVTYSLGEYKDTIKDINRALDGNYPDHLKCKLWERKGKALFELGSWPEARAAFENAIIWLTKSRLDEAKREIFKSQLESLVQQCSGDNIKRSAVEITAIPELTHGPNPHLQSGSNAIEVQYSPSMGRHIVAKVDINPGDVLAVEKPYSSITSPNSYFFFCFYCHKRCHSLLPCLHCTLVFFCDKKCLTHCWDESHSIECNILPSLLLLGCGQLELLAFRVLMIATEKGKKLFRLASSLSEIESFDEPSRKGFTDDVYLSAIHNLEGNTDLRDVSYLLCRSVYAACMLHVLDINTDFFNRGPVENVSSLKKCIELEENSKLRCDKIFAGGLILKYLQSIPSNAYEISEMRIMPGNGTTEYSNIGSAVYSLLSRINHSCDPHVVRHSYSGSTAVLTAIQAIKKGEQIFDNYGDHYATHNKTERQSHLKSHYLFTCQCVACIENWPLYNNLPAKNPIYYQGANVPAVKRSSTKCQYLMSIIDSGCNRNKLPEWLDFFYHHLKLLQDSVARPWKEYNDCQEVIVYCLSLLRNHYHYKSSPSSLINLKDEDVGVSPF